MQIPQKTTLARTRVRQEKYTQIPEVTMLTLALVLYVWENHGRPDEHARYELHLPTPQRAGREPKSIQEHFPRSAMETGVFACQENRSESEASVKSVKATCFLLRSEDAH